MTEKDPFEQDQQLNHLDEEEESLEPEREEKANEFMSRWKERHQAYLRDREQASTSQSEEELEDTEKEGLTTNSKKRNSTLQALRKNLQNLGEQAPLIDEDVEEQAAKQSQRQPIPSDVLWKGMPVILFSASLLILSLYFISPFSKQKQFTVTGNQALTAELVQEYSLISDQDYILTTYLHQDAYAKNIELNSKLVKSAKMTYTFPNHFTIAIEEYKEIGYVKQGNDYYSVLSSGEISELATASDQLPATYTTINLDNQDFIKELAVQLGTVDGAILSLIQSITLTPSKATADLVTLTMTDGNQVLVPISEIGRKLPYYPKIASQLTVASTIDMEVGIYSYAN